MREIAAVQFASLFQSCSFFLGPEKFNIPILSIKSSRTTLESGGTFQAKEFNAGWYQLSCACTLCSWVTPSLPTHTPTASVHATLCLKYRAFSSVPSWHGRSQNRGEGQPWICHKARATAEGRPCPVSLETGPGCLAVDNWLPSDLCPSLPTGSFQCQTVG